MKLVRTADAVWTHGWLSVGPHTGPYLDALGTVRVADPTLGWSAQRTLLLRIQKAEGSAAR